MSATDFAKGTVAGLRGESFGDMARRVGAIAGIDLPDGATDAQALLVLKDAAADDAVEAINPLITEAEAQAVAAESYANDAANSAMAAAGFVGGVMYATTAEGVAAVAEGALFTVAGDGADTYAVLYRKESGAAVKKADLPNRSVFDLPAASGTDDAGVINAIISLASAGGGGLVRARRGSAYQISDTILMRSGVTLDLSGATLKNIAPSAIRMISNPAMLDAGVSCTISWSAGLEATVTQTAHGHEVGDYVWLRGADQAQFRIVARVVSITSASQYVVQLWRMPTTAATGTITAVKADVDMALIGANLDYDNVPAASGYRNVPVYLSGVANLRVQQGRVINGRKMALTIGAVNGFTVDGWHCPWTFSDGIKIYGPALGGDVRNVFGHTSDDFVSVHPREYAVFASDYQISNGDCIGINLTNINGRTENGSMFVLYPTDSGPIIDGIVVDGVHGGASAISFGSAIRAYTYAPETAGTIGSFVARNVTGFGPRIFSSINCIIDLLELDFAGCKPIDPAAPFMLVDADSTIKKMVLKGRTDDANLTTSRFMDLDGQIDHMVCDNLTCSVPSFFLSNTTAGAILGKLTIKGCELGAAGKILLRFSNEISSTPKIAISDSVITSLHVVETNWPVVLDVENTELVLGGYLVNGVNPPSGTTTIRVSTRNARKTGGGWIEGQSNIRYEIFSADVSENVSLDIISRVPGGFINNLTTGIGTITEAGIMDCVNLAPNSWRLRGDPENQRY